MTNYNRSRGGYSRSENGSRQYRQGSSTPSRRRYGRDEYEYDQDYDRDEDFENEYDDYGPESEWEEEYDGGYESGSRRGRRGDTGRRGFASMDEEQQREIASMGGRAAHEYGSAHEFTPEEAREAGRIGGEHTRQTHGRRFYQEIGRMGGEERRRELGPEGYAELGRMGGRARGREVSRGSREVSRGNGRRQPVQGRQRQRVSTRSRSYSR